MAFKRSNLNSSKIIIGILVILAIVYIIYNMRNAYENFQVYNTFTNSVVDSEVCTSHTEVAECIQSGCTYSNLKCKPSSGVTLFFNPFW